MGRRPRLRSKWPNLLGARHALAVEVALTVMEKDAAVPDHSPLMGSEDCAFMLEQRPGNIALLAEENLDEVFPARLSAHTPLGRNGQPEDVNGTVAWLLSDDALFVTGQEITVNGGFTLGGIRLRPRRRQLLRHTISSHFQDYIGHGD